MEIRTERQAAPVADPVEAKIAIVRPMIASILMALSNEAITDFGYATTNKPRGALPLRSLGRLHRKGDGDVGIAFEYAVHDAVLRRDPVVLERISDALRECRIRHAAPESIFFAVEKSGAQEVINTRMELITSESLVLAEPGAGPIALKQHLGGLAEAFRRQSARQSLPQSIRGLWKADLFLGESGLNHWVGTTVKTNPSQLEGAAGLRVGVIPSKAGKRDGIRLDESRNLVICPIPYDGGFMQFFYEAWLIVRALMERNFEMPPELDLPTPEDRAVARVFVDRRQYTVAEVLAATEKFAQPYLLVSNLVEVSRDTIEEGVGPETTTLLVPQAIVERGIE